MTSVYAFSYKDEQSEVVNKAKEIAKRNNQSFSKLVIEALTNYIDEQKNVMAPNCGAIRLSKTNTNHTQTTLYSFSNLDPQERFKEIKVMDKRKRVELQISSKEVINQCIAANRVE